MDNWGFIGFGEVGTRFARAVLEHSGKVRVFVRKPDAVLDRDIEVCGSIAELVRASDMVVSCVWPGAAVEVAKQAAMAEAPALYLDVNNVGIPACNAMEQTLGLAFHKGAVLAPVARHGAQAPMLVAGPRADELTQALNAHGFKARSVGSKPAQSAAIKILRNLVTKCIVAPLADLLAAAEYYGISDEVLASAGEFLSAEPFPELARMLMIQSKTHARRLAEEMDEVAEALVTAGVSDRVPLLAKQVFQEMED